jgi:hypothetical protein
MTKEYGGGSERAFRLVTVIALCISGCGNHDKSGPGLVIKGGNSTITITSASPPKITVQNSMWTCPQPSDCVTSAPQLSGQVYDIWYSDNGGPQTEFSPLPVSVSLWHLELQPYPVTLQVVGTGSTLHAYANASGDTWTLDASKLFITLNPAVASSAHLSRMVVEDPAATNRTPQNFCAGVNGGTCNVSIQIGPH